MDRINRTLVGLLLLLGAAGLVTRSTQFSTAAPAAAASPIPVSAAKPVRGAISRTITLPGEVKAAQQATLYAKVTGYLKTISVDKGDEVDQGALLAEIEVPELLADAARCKAEAELAAIDYKRVSQAQKNAPDLVTPLSVDTAKGKHQVALANLDRAETLLTFTRILAPFSGIVTRRMVDPGAFIPAATAGSPQSAALLTLADFRSVRVQVAVPEVEASLVRKGQPAQVSVEGLPNRRFQGQVTRFAYSLDEATKTMLTEIELPNPELALRPGMYATIRIGIERKENALLVPAEAVASEKAHAFVFVVAGHQAKKTPIQTGFQDGTSVEVTSGLKGDELVVRLTKAGVTDGQAVKVLEAQ